MNNPATESKHTPEAEVAPTLLMHVPGNANLIGHYSAATVDVVRERERQIEKEGWTPEHDDSHPNGSLAEAGACYAMAFENQPMPMDWPWEVNWWKPKDRRSNLVRAAALLIAEIERLDRAENYASRNAALHQSTGGADHG